MRGPLVKEAQGLINSYFGTVKVEQDTRFGPQTEEAVKAFQAAVKIQVDGVIGLGTWSALRAQGKPSGHCVAAGFDPFDLRTLECFFDKLRQRLGWSDGGKPAGRPVAASAHGPGAVHSNCH